MSSEIFLTSLNCQFKKRTINKDVIKVMSLKIDFIFQYGVSVRMLGKYKSLFQQQESGESVCLDPW